MVDSRIRSIRMMIGLIFLTAAVTSGFVIASHSFATESRDAKLKQLLQERLEVLQQIVAQMEELHKERVSDLKNLYAARVAMFRAKVELCASDQERIEVLEELLSEAKHREMIERKSLRPNLQGVEKMAASIPIEEAHSDRLKIEIEIERLRIK